ncbi:MAG: DUF6134 family protein [Alphaproteobacteria bacterium]|nr:DUF6134 family protein [Alphaproteobacteria bacterium]
MMLPRRHFLAAALALAPGAARAALPRLDFEARRNGSLLGSHSVAFARTGQDLTVTVAVDYKVTLGPITLYRYALRGSEAWRGETLMEARFETDDDGRREFMRAQRDARGLAVEGSASGAYVAPEGSLPASHWNRREIDAPMINPQNGELLRFAVTDAGSGEIRTRGGIPFAARRFVLTGPSSLDLWYDTSGAWAGLQAVAKDGSLIAYARIQPPEG